MVDSKFTHLRMTGQDRPRIATRTLAGTTGTCFASVRRPASALTCPRRHANSDQPSRVRWMERHSVAHLVGRTLARLGVDTVFGLAGSGNFVVTNALVAGGARFVS